MITSEYILELSNVFHSGQVEAGTCLQKMIGTVRTGVILKDVSLEVHGGELSAVLGSKGKYKIGLIILPILFQRKKSRDSNLVDISCQFTGGKMLSIITQPVFM